MKRAEFEEIVHGLRLLRSYMHEYPSQWRDILSKHLVECPAITGEKEAFEELVSHLRRQVDVEPTRVVIVQDFDQIKVYGPPGVEVVKFDKNQRNTLLGDQTNARLLEEHEHPRYPGYTEI